MALTNGGTIELNLALNLIEDANSDTSSDASAASQNGLTQSPLEASFLEEDKFTGPIYQANLRANSAEYHTRVLDVLSRIGYHRARVACVSDYDKIIGGLSWIMSRFEKTEKRPAPGKAFQDYFRETGRQPKSDEDRQKECEAIVKGLIIMKCPYHIRVQELMNPRLYYVALIIDWLLRKLRKLQKDPFFFKYYQFVLNSPAQEEKENRADPFKPTLVTMFRRALYMPNKMRLSQAKHCDMFDYSIVLDKKVTSKQIIAEYITYARGGVRTYPLVFDKLLKEDLTEDDTDPFDLTPNVYHILEELGNGMFEDLDEVAQEALDAAYRSIRSHRFGVRLREMHARAVSEFHKLNTIQKKYETMNTLYQKLSTEVYDNAPFSMAASMNKTVTQTKDRAGSLVHMMIQDYEDAYEEIDRIQARGYCPFGREEVDLLRETAEARLKKLNDMRRRSKFIGNTLNRFNTAIDDFNGAPYKEMENSVPPPESFVDQIMPGELGMWVEKINHTVPRMIERSFQGKEGPVLEIRNAYVAYMSDCRVCIADFQHKAQLLKNRRIEMSKQLEKMEAKVFVEKLKGHSYNKILEALRKLNGQVYEFRDVVKELEKDSNRFNKTPIRSILPPSKKTAAAPAAPAAAKK